jgi:DNA-binding MarR family transcriptional regulator
MKEELLLGSIFKLFRLLTGQMIQNIKDQGIELTPMHVRTLKIIRMNEYCTTQTVVGIMYRDKAQVTRLVNELVKKELVYKKANPEDKRSQFLLLTDKGNEIFEQLRPTEHNFVKKMTHDIDKKKLAKFTEVIDLMAENLSHDSSNAK